MKKSIGIGLSYFVPLVAFAQAPDDVKLLVKKISFFVLNPAISVIFGLAFIFFLWGVAEYFWQNDSDEARAKGARHILWGLVGMFIMFSAYVFIKIIVNTIGADVPVEEFKPTGI